MRILHLFLVVVAGALGACEKPRSDDPMVEGVKAELTKLKIEKALADQEIATLKASLAELKVSRQASEQAKPQDLTREVAADMLTGSIGELKMGVLEFREGGVEAATRDGYVSRESYDKGVLTPKALQLANGLFKDNSFYAGHKAFIFYKESMGQHLDKITGIAPAGPDARQVEFTTEYNLPESLSPLRQYVYTGVRHIAIFQKYDNGWRVVRVE